MLLDGVGNFNGCRGRPMCHRQNRYQRFAVLLALDGKRDDTRAVLATFFPPALRFVFP
jgi:hypothetical protein